MLRIKIATHQIPSNGITTNPATIYKNELTARVSSQRTFIENLSELFSDPLIVTNKKHNLDTKI